MSHDEMNANNPDRRSFLQAGAVAAAAASTITVSAHSRAQDPAPAVPVAPAKHDVLPKRKLGKTGLEMTLLELGSGGIRDRSVLDKMLRLSYANGIRTFDTAKLYGSEPGFKRWFEQSPEVRKEIVLVTKDSPRVPSDLLKMVDERLEALGTDYIDFLFVHGLGDDMKLETAIDFAKGKEMAQVADKIRKSGKAKFIGFSTHHQSRAAIIKAAAEGGFHDAIMLQYTPWLDKDDPLNKALDAAHAAGIGLITMKQVAGQFPAKPKINVLEEVVKRTPKLAEMKLTAYQGLLQAIWTDERISGSCVSIKNVEQLRDNSDAARRYAPWKTAEIHQLRDAALAFGPTLCADCDGRCSTAAGTKAELGNLTRFYTYHEHHGHRTEAREEYNKLGLEARDWSNADLAAAQAACPNKLNFAELLPEVDRLLG